MLRDMFTLGGWVMFFLGVVLAAWVKSLLGRTKSAVAG